MTFYEIDRPDPDDITTLIRLETVMDEVETSLKRKRDLVDLNRLRNRFVFQELARFMIRADLLKHSRRFGGVWFMTRCERNFYLSESGKLVSHNLGVWTILAMVWISVVAGTALMWLLMSFISPSPFWFVIYIIAVAIVLGWRILNFRTITALPTDILDSLKCTLEHTELDWRSIGKLYNELDRQAEALYPE
jgi:hypothetical protein